MKIGAGIYKNRSVKVLGSISRPTTVRSRTVVFDILTNIVEPGFTFLDAFAGSGIMGMEALSRKASHVIFFDINVRCVKLIEQNLKTMDKLQGTYTIRRCNALVPPKGSPVNVVFLDPPYHLPHLIHGSLKKLYKYNWINEHTIIIIETSPHTKLKPVQNLPLKLLRTKLISRSLIQFFQLDQC